MRVVIDIPEEEYEYVWCKGHIGSLGNMSNYITNGEPLPKGHGRLIDADALINSIEKKSERLKNLDTINGLCGAINLIYEAKSIIEADKEDD